MCLAQAIVALWSLQVLCILLSLLSFDSRLSIFLSLSSQYERVYHILTNYVESLLPPSLNKVVDFLVRGREEFARRLC